AEEDGGERGDRVHPQEGTGLAEVAEGLRGGGAAGPVRLLVVADLESEPPVVGLLAPVTGQDPSQRRELDAARLAPQRLGDQGGGEQLAADGKQVPDRAAVAGGRRPHQLDVDEAQPGHDRLLHPVGDVLPGGVLDVRGEHLETGVGVDAPGADGPDRLVAVEGVAGGVGERWRTVAHSGPAGSSRSTRPRSTATRTPSAVRGLETLARSQTRRGSPWVCRVRCASDTPSAWAKSTSTGISGALTVSTPSIWHTAPSPPTGRVRRPRARTLHQPCTNPSPPPRRAVPGSACSRDTIGGGQP